jgi:hypothetical protein
MNTCIVDDCHQESRSKGYCNVHYKRLWRYGSTKERKYGHNRRYKLDYEIDENGCFICTSHKVNAFGYPEVHVNGKRYVMSRFVYQEMFGDIPEGLVIRHTCDNRRCINPEHLETGTKADNTRDMMERGRHVSVNGEKAYFSKLTNDKVLKLRTLYDEGFNYHELSEMFQITYRTAYDVVTRKTWKHI